MGQSMLVQQSIPSACLRRARCYRRQSATQHFHGNETWVFHMSL